MKRRAVTLWPEWAAAIAWLDKLVENRQWAPSAAQLGPGGWVCIHAGGTVGGLGRAPKSRELFEAHLDDRADALWSVFEMAGRAGWTWKRDPRKLIDMAGSLDQLVDLRPTRCVARGRHRRRARRPRSRCSSGARSGAGRPPGPCRRGVWDVPDEIAHAVRERIAA